MAGVRSGHPCGRDLGLSAAAGSEQTEVRTEARDSGREGCWQGRGHNWTKLTSADRESQAQEQLSVVRKPRESGPVLTTQTPCQSLPDLSQPPWVGKAEAATGPTSPWLGGPYRQEQQTMCGSCRELPRRHALPDSWGNSSYMECLRVYIFKMRY